MAINYRQIDRVHSCVPEMKKRSSLMTPDPYHIPGYGGYVTQLKYQLGDTFGSHTHKLLTDASVASSGNTVLASTEVSPGPPAAKTADDFFSSSVYGDGRSWGNQKYLPQMIPGYGGYIPKSMHYFGNRYAESCHYAISAFKDDQNHYEAKTRDMRKGIVPVRSSPKPQTAPLMPVAKRPKPYLPAYVRKNSISPHHLPSGDAQKLFMSGYTGFIPKAQKYLGQGFPIISRQALSEHAGEYKRFRQLVNTPVVLEQPMTAAPPSCLLYTKGRGLIPNYTGHIPGQRYKYGLTFGTSTCQAVSEIFSA